jgi:hypothetical protein
LENICKGQVVACSLTIVEKLTEQESSSIPLAKAVVAHPSFGLAWISSAAGSRLISADLPTDTVTGPDFFAFFFKSSLGLASCTT